MRIVYHISGNCVFRTKDGLEAVVYDRNADKRLPIILRTLEPLPRADFVQNTEQFNNLMRECSRRYELRGFKDDGLPVYQEV